MQQRFSFPQNFQKRIQPSEASPRHSFTAPKELPQDDLAKIFNTALVSTHLQSAADFSSELKQLTESTSFKAILNSVRQLAKVQGISERQAAEQVILTFNRLNDVWSKYLFQEGVDKLRNSKRR